MTNLRVLVKSSLAAVHASCSAAGAPAHASCKDKASPQAAKPQQKWKQCLISARRSPPPGTGSHRSQSAMQPESCLLDAVCCRLLYRASWGGHGICLRHLNKLSLAVWQGSASEPRPQGRTADQDMLGHVLVTDGRRISSCSELV